MAAQEWANKKKQQLERAQRMREERKANLARNGEMAMGSSSGFGANGNLYGSSYNRPASKEEINQARGALSLLKKKMSREGSRGSLGFTPGNDDDGGFGTNQRDSYGYRSQYDDQTTSYTTAGSSRGFDYDNDNSNNNYRRQFKPNLGNNNGSSYSNADDGYAPVQSRVGKPPSNRRSAKTERPQEDEVPSSYVSGRGATTRAPQYGVRSSNNRFKGSYASYENENDPSDDDQQENSYASRRSQGVRASKNFDSDYSYEKRQPVRQIQNKPSSMRQGMASGNTRSSSGFKNQPSSSYNAGEEERVGGGAGSNPFGGGNEDSNPFGDAAEPDPTDLRPCNGCGRKFNSQALQKHAKICKKVFQSKRKKFDTSAQRTEDQPQTDSGSSASYGGGFGKRSGTGRGGAGKKSRPTAGGAGSGKSNKWKKQSEQFRAAMRAARPDNGSNAGGFGGGGGFDSNSAPSYDDDLTPCPHCGRKFNETAAERHIPICERNHKINMMKNGGGRGRGRGRARGGYGRR
eukprot:CAMPEP_0115009844 /NCGR_PEP_ID=MMETSP0216-20121206/22907_1 /TAXON_ID=223996 /ORGANISM="Protocruzia adherens, Strain Boccale" /LENGTH=516 /DNA_ID=CAMNT_0002377835 /DNA_START=95 /DNA_END=1645 /DNA_ORIENTATION=-